MLLFLVELDLGVRIFSLGQQLFELFHTIDRVFNRLKITQSSTQPAAGHIKRPAALGRPSGRILLFQPLDMIALTIVPRIPRKPVCSKRRCVPSASSQTSVSPRT